MKFTIEVGEVEKHLVEFDHNQLIGSLLIKVDEKPVYQNRRFINEPKEEVYQFVVGQLEKTEVRIEKIRKHLFGHRNAVYVDKRLARVYDGF
ncbi:MAG TPA: hypothetical protein VFZ59_25730 [Verrucomicrobiae bacterium]|nr:hypothetical protein [Verrucomicrobiae bacterium]